MNTEHFEDYGALYELCGDLVAALVKAREEISDEVWDALDEGPWHDIVCAAMDVEYAYDRCEEM